MSRVTKRAIYQTHRPARLRTRNNFKLKLEKPPKDYPSRFGSHSSMVVEELSPEPQLPAWKDPIDVEIGGLNYELKSADMPIQVRCKDEFGEYITLKSRLDQGCDPNRYTSARISKLFHREGKEKS